MIENACVCVRVPFFEFLALKLNSLQTTNAFISFFSVYFAFIVLFCYKQKLIYPQFLLIQHICELMMRRSAGIDISMLSQRRNKTILIHSAT